MTSHAKDGWRADGEPADQAGDPLPPPPPPPHGSGGDPGVEYDYDAEPADAAEPAGTGFGGLSGPAGSDGDESGLRAEVAEYREALMRVKADFDNYRKRTDKERTATVERAAEKLVTDLLPVLDACEAALDHGADDVEPIYKSLLDTLEKGGLHRMDTNGTPFDPNLHEAVIHEPGDGDETIVVDSLRSGYLWNGRVVRAAMVKVQG